MGNSEHTAASVSPGFLGKLASAAVDVNDDGFLNIGDTIALLQEIFSSSSGSNGICAMDTTTEDPLDCVSATCP